MTLAQHRAARGLSLEQCAVALGLSPSSKGWLSEIENGKRDASLRLALRIEKWSKGKVKAASVCAELRPANDPSQQESAA
jgi:transcriptional regulator with XRE-family HTH domain